MSTSVEACRQESSSLKRTLFYRPQPIQELHLIRVDNLFVFNDFFVFLLFCFQARFGESEAAAGCHVETSPLGCGSCNVGDAIIDCSSLPSAGSSGQLVRRWKLFCNVTVSSCRAFKWIAWVVLSQSV